MTFCQAEDVAFLIYKNRPVSGRFL